MIYDVKHVHDVQRCILEQKHRWGDLPPSTTMIDRMPTRATLTCNILITNEIRPWYVGSLP